MRLQLESSTDVFNLDDVLIKDEGVQATAGVSGLGLPPVSVQWLEGAGDGALFRGQRVLPRDIDLPLYLSAPDRAGLQKLVSRLALMLAGPCILRLIEEDGSSWHTEVRRVGGGNYVYGEDTTGERDLVLVITLRAGDPFWTYSQPSRKVIENSGSGRGLLTSLAKLQVSSSQAIGSITLENFGDAPAYPLWEVNGPGSNFRAALADGQEFQWNGTLLTDEKLIIDTRAGTVRDGTGANRYGEMAPAPKLWSIPPGTTTATATLEGTSAGTLVKAGGPIWTNLATNPRGETQSGTVNVRQNLMTNPRPLNYASSATAPAGWQDTWAGGGAANFSSGSDGVLKKTWTADATSDHNVFAGPKLTANFTVGVALSARMKIRIASTPGVGPTSGMALRFDFRDSGGVNIGYATGSYVNWGAVGDWLTLECRNAVPPTGTASIRIVPLPNSSVWKPLTGTVIEMSEPMVEEGSVVGAYFDGSTTNAGDFTYSWGGTVGAAISKCFAPVAVDQTKSVDGDAGWFPAWSTGTAGSRYQKWRAKAGTPTAGYRVARTKALARDQIVAGETYTLLARMRVTGWGPTTVRTMITNGPADPIVMDQVNFTGVDSSWKDVRVVFTAKADAGTDAQIGLYCGLPNTPPVDAHGEFDLAYWAIIPGDYQGDYFDGDSSDSLQAGVFDWTGTPHASTSTITLATVTGRSSITCSWRPRKWMVI